MILPHCSIEDFVGIELRKLKKSLKLSRTRCFCGLGLVSSILGTSRRASLTQRTILCMCKKKKKKLRPAPMFCNFFLTKVNIYSEVLYQVRLRNLWLLKIALLGVVHNFSVWNFFVVLEGAKSYIYLLFVKKQGPKIEPWEVPPLSTTKHGK